MKSKSRQQKKCITQDSRDSSHNLGFFFFVGYWVLPKNFELRKGYIFYIIFANNILVILVKGFIYLLEALNKAFI